MLFFVDYVYSTLNKLGISTSKFQDACVLLVLGFCSVWIFANYNFINRVIPSYPYNPIRFFNSNLESPVCMEEFIKENIPEFRENAWSLFNPFLFNGHLQTIFSGVRRFHNSDVLYFERQMQYAGDGGSVALDHVISKEKFETYDGSKEFIPENQPEILDDNIRYMSKEAIENQSSDDDKAILLALTGLSGSSAESYIRCLYSRLSKTEDFDMYVINSRGCGNVKLSTPRLFCALWTEDVREAVNFFHDRYPNRKIYLFGVSLGSIVMANYLAEEGDNCKVSLGVAVASIWDLRASSYFLENGFISSLLYSTTMTFPLLMLLKSHANELLQNPFFKSQYTNEIIRKIWKLKDFDNVFTSRMFGFTCADDYYLNASPIYKIDKIKTPYINISALDDPITGGLQIGALPIDQVKHNPYISMVNTSLGGHVGFFKWCNTRWYADPLAKLYQDFHKKISSQPGFEIQVDEKYLPKKPLIDGKLSL